mmetsp:Transcript_10864/g.18090  ORF Transcript_10864/g.18090 Transcript_10864/m.18090 type:complete len:123 (-) Transcript_10864:116-484(-)
MTPARRRRVAGGGGGKVGGDRLAQKNKGGRQWFSCLPTTWRRREWEALRPRKRGSNPLAKIAVHLLAIAARRAPSTRCADLLDSIVIDLTERGTGGGEEKDRQHSLLWSAGWFAAAAAILRA